MADIDVQTIIDRFWEARLAGDTDAVLSLFTPDAAYEMMGARSFADIRVVGPDAAIDDAATELIKMFKFHGIKQQTAIVDGLTAATVSMMTVSYRGGAPSESALCDIWEFDPAGKITSLKQFVDTDLLRRMMTAG